MHGKALLFNLLTYNAKAPLKILLKNEMSLNMTSPCLLPPISTILRIEVDSPRYATVSLDFENNNQHKKWIGSNRMLYVKRNDGYLPYEVDPWGKSHITSRLFPRTSVSHQYVMNDYIESLNTDFLIGVYICI
jgi:hypothetical protein